MTSHGRTGKRRRRTVAIVGICLLVCLILSALYSQFYYRSSDFYRLQRLVEPLYLVLMRAWSLDGIHWETDREVIFHQASTSHHAELDGREIILFWEASGPFGLMSIVEGIEEPRYILEEQCGALIHQCVDPNLIQLPDGRLRLYYVAVFSDADPANSLEDMEVRSAVSSDGIEWSAEPGVRFKGLVMDPDVVPLPDGRYRMYFTARVPEHLKGPDDLPIAICSAISDDGLTFVEEPGLRWKLGSASSTILLPDGRFRMYYHHCEATERIRGGDPTSVILSAVSDDGLEFTEEPGVRLTIPLSNEHRFLGAESPSVIRRPAGLYTMTFTSIEEPPFPENWLEGRRMVRVQRFLDAEPEPGRAFPEPP